MKDITKLILGALVVLFGLLALFFGVKYNQQMSQSSVYLTEKMEINTEYDKLQKEFDELTDQLQAIETTKNVRIDSLKADIQSKKINLSRLLRKERLSRTELEQARAMIDELRNEKTKLLAQIQTLSTENAQLKQENKTIQITLNDVGQKNRVLKQEKEVLVSENTVVKQEKEKVIAQKKEVEEEKKIVEQKAKELIKEKQANAPKVKYAEIIPVKSIVVEGIKYKNSGKEKSTKNFKRVDKLAITFNAGKNPVAQAGQKEFLLRVINPDGTVMYDRQRGSGTFTASDGKGMKYTTKTAIDYKNQAKSVTLFWRQGQPYQKGVYQVQVYQDGFEVGKGSFELRGGL